MAERERESRLGRAAGEFTERIAQGEDPSIEEYAGRFPEVADEIRQVFPALRVMREVTLEPSVGAPPQELGDFRIHRELGRGGMAVVYEAQQLSLGRQVALKVLPFAAVMDPRQLQRFKNEVQAAAHLHHTHIVPVYSVGCERGVHYYAMQYIEGLTVGQVIEELRGNGKAPSSPVSSITKGKSTESAGYCKSVARLGIQAAEALDHAHQQGVIHRDIKPANLIVDGVGHLWITDFGLASFTNNPGLTMTGDIVGTLRYMSPEQALAKRVPVDHRTDIYSLGVTLYEFVTLEGAFQGDDPHRVIQDIALKEPTSARTLNPAVPVELETILMKAMAKSPEERYATAQTLAEDLQRFLEHRPIHARRPTLVQRAAKWAHRNNRLVAAAAAMLVFAVIGLTVSTILIADERNEKAKALAEAERQGARARANLDRVAGERNEKTKALAEAERQRARARANLDRAMDAVDEFLKDVGATHLASVSGMEPVRRRLLERALGFYQGFLAAEGDDPVVRRRTARAFHQTGLIRGWLGDLPEAESALRRAIDLRRELLPLTETELSASLDVLGSVLRSAGEFARAEEAYREAMAIEETFVRRFPHEPVHRHNRAYALRQFASMLQDARRFEEAEAAYREAARLLEPLPAAGLSAVELLEVQAGLGDVLRETGRLTEAEAAYAAAAELAARHPVPVQGRPGIQARREAVAGELLARAGRIDEAQQAFGRSVELVDAIIARFPGRVELRWWLVGTLEKQGNALAGANRLEQAQPVFEKARDVLEGLTDTRSKQLRAGVLHNLGTVFGRQGRLEEAEEPLRRAVQLREELSLGPAVDAEDLVRLADSYGNLGMLRMVGKRTDEAVAAWRRYVELQERIGEEFPDVVRPMTTLAKVCDNLGMICMQRDDYAGALAYHRKALEADPDFGGAHNSLAWALVTCPDTALRDVETALVHANRAVAIQPRSQQSWNTLGVVRYRAGAYADAIVALNRSEELAGKRGANNRFFLAMAHWRLGERDEARACYAWAVARMAEKRPKDKQLRRFRAEAEELMEDGR